MRDFIDQKYGSTESITLRYHKLNSFGLKEEELKAASIKEGAQIFYLTEYKNVPIYILDGTSFMHTGTFKSIDACVISALAKRENYNKIAFPSGGNTGSALTAYLQKQGIETFFFCPKDNLVLLDSNLFKNPRSHLISVEEVGKVKESCSTFINLNKQVKKIPLEWKISSFESLGAFIAEYIHNNEEFDWIAQMVSAAFAPIAYYKTLWNLKNENYIKKIPKFLGVQQKENCYMYEVLNKVQPKKRINSTKELLIPVVYDTEPFTYKTTKLFFDLLKKNNGNLTTISKDEFKKFLEKKLNERNIIDLLDEKKIRISVYDNEVIEKAGLTAIAGVYKEIDNGLIKKEDKVLCCLSGGISRADRKTIPEYTISKK